MVPAFSLAADLVEMSDHRIHKFLVFALVGVFDMGSGYYGRQLFNVGRSMGVRVGVWWSIKMSEAWHVHDENSLFSHYCACISDHIYLFLLCPMMFQKIECRLRMISSVAGSRACLPKTLNKKLHRIFGHSFYPYISSSSKWFRQLIHKSSGIFGYSPEASFLS